jgi:integrase/recombinase XerD
LPLRPSKPAKSAPSVSLWHTQDLEGGVIVFRSLKKRTKKDIHRAVPVPPPILDQLNLVHNIREQQADKRRRKSKPLWNWSRTTGWRYVLAVVRQAGIKDGPHCSPKGLRHSFGVNAIEKGIPLNMLQKWMGHSQMETTAIYANAMGAEEQSIAAKMWS